MCSVMSPLPTEVWAILENARTLAAPIAPIDRTSERSLRSLRQRLALICASVCGAAQVLSQPAKTRWFGGVADPWQSARPELIPTVVADWIAQRRPLAVSSRDVNERNFKFEKSGCAECLLEE